jgi:type I restriction-modification system DNA methylase subunit
MTSRTSVSKIPQSLKTQNMADITINEVRRRLQLFAKEHSSDRDEKQYAQQFMRDFYACFGLSKSSASMFEKKVLKFGNKRGFIDSFIPGVLLVEQKTTGEDLYRAFEQAKDYALAITNEFEKPHYILVCDFQTFHLYNLHDLKKEPHVCTLAEISKRADWFMFLVDKRVIAYSEELPVNRKAVEQIAKLHDALLKANYTGKDLESFLTRLLFCLFADDTGIFGTDGQFKKLVAKTKEDGSDLGMAIAMLFQVLNTAHDKRQTNLDEALNAFEYVNGGLFNDQIAIPSFDFDLRTILVKCSELDWSGISPAIFGAMFQSVLEAGATDTAHRRETRRELGAHYTSERNILKVIQPLFLDDLHKEFEQASNKPKLQALYDKLHTLKFFDPACGCGNFLVIAYRELRRIENDVIAKLYFKGEQGGLLDIKGHCKVSIEQFYGIEIDDAAVHIARVAMYITDHQLNLESGSRFGETRATVPLISTPHIQQGNALRTDWNNVIMADECDFIFGNPPFIGKQFQTELQKEDLELIGREVKNYKLLDYVAGWYLKAVEYIKNTSISVAFVSTNSITQGEQVAVLWSYLIHKGTNINFAHRTFKWSNEGMGVAAVHCVIVGFSLVNKDKKSLFQYDKVDENTPILSIVNQINPYLINAPTVIIDNRRTQITSFPEINYGSFALDDGNYTLTEEEVSQLVRSNPIQKLAIREFIGAREFLHNEKRYAIWLKDLKPNQIANMPDILLRIKKVKEWRLASKRANTVALGSTPSIFAEIRQPDVNYLALPTISSEKREYLPIAMLSNDVIASNQLYVIPSSDLTLLSILSSSFHNAWIRTVGGRLKSDYRYSSSVIYNNFVFPINLTDENIELLTNSANQILKARNHFISSSLAQLYDPLTMPVELVKAHEANNKAVDRAYGYNGADDDASRVSFLFKRYEELTSLLPATTVKKKRVKKNDNDLLI